MKRYLPIVMAIAIACLLSGCASTSMTQEQPILQDPLYGIWEGSIDVQGMQLGLQYIFVQSPDGSYQTYMNVPMQMATNIRALATTVTNGTIIVDMSNMGIMSTFAIDDMENPTLLTGTYEQGGSTYPMTLTKTDLDPATYNKRPQDPQKPYPYISDEVTIPQNKEQFTLAATITRPNAAGTYPAVVLVSGSGSQNRDEELMNHRPFLVLSDALTKAGYVVARYDDRGYAQSTGDATFASTYELADDTAAVIDWLKGQSYVDPSKILVIGHSEGGIIAPILAATRDDLAGIVMLAGPGVPGKYLSNYQSEAMLRAAGLPEPVVQQMAELNRQSLEIVIDSTKTPQQRMEELTQLLLAVGTPEDQLPAQLAQFASLFLPWTQTFLVLDPAEYLKQVTIPVLVLNGDKDFQVPVELNIDPIKKALDSAGNTTYEVKLYEGLNHLFQPSVTGMLDEYSVIETTIEPQVMTDIIRWLDEVTK